MCRTWVARASGCRYAAAAAADAAFAAFPRLTTLAATSREVMHAGHHRIGARMATSDGMVELAPVEVWDVADRVGSGDAFAAGVLHGLRRGAPPAAALEDGLALAALKHSIAGDAAIFGEDHIRAWREGHRDVRR